MLDVYFVSPAPVPKGVQPLGREGDQPVAPTVAGSVLMKRTSSMRPGGAEAWPGGLVP